VAEVAAGHSAPSEALALRPLPDRIMRRVLFIDSTSRSVSDSQVHRMFSTSIFVSATRCLLSYVIFPIVAVALGVATGLSAAIGLPIGVAALVFDVIGIRRFWLVDHQWRWRFSALYLAVIVLVLVLLVRDIVNLVH
jgi:hypothetical protein